MANPEYSFDVWTVKQVANHDFGQDHWSYEDDKNYIDNNTVDNNDHAIETWDDNNGNNTDYDPWSQPNNPETDNNDYTDPYQNSQG